MKLQEKISSGKLRIQMSFRPHKKSLVSQLVMAQRLNCESTIIQEIFKMIHLQKMDKEC